MNFAQPVWFWALLLVPVFVALYILAERYSKRMIARIVAPRLRNDLAAGVSYWRRRIRLVLMLLGLSALITAMARPQWGYQWQEAKLKGRDVLIAVDVSKSMLANDLSPNRLTRARLATQDLIEMLKGERLGLIAFAGSAFLQAPLTADHGAVLTATQELDTDLIPRGGTNIASAIETAIEAFGKGEGGERALILFTDGEELDAKGVDEAKKAKKAGIKIFTVGVGSAEGSVIPLEKREGGTDFVRDRSNQIVKSKLDESRLREIAQETGGFYSHLDGTSTVENIVNAGIKGMEEKESDTKMSRKPIERYQWPLAIGIGLLMVGWMIGDRRRRPHPPASAKAPARQAATVALAIATALLVWPEMAPATDEAEDLYAAGKYEEALKHYEARADTWDGGPDSGNKLARALGALSPKPEELDFNIGAAAYKSKEYDKAMEAFGKAILSENKPLRESAFYNLGNTLYQRGAGKEKPDEKIKEWKSAIQKYDDALRLNPENQNAKHNKEVVEKLLAELEKQEQEKKDQQKQDQKQDQKDQQKQDQQEKQDQQQGDQKDQQQQNQDQKGDQKKDSQQQQGKDQQQDQQQGDEKKEQQGQSGESKKDQPKQGEDGESKDQQGKGEQKEEQEQSGKGDQEKKDQAGKEQEKQKSEEGKGEDSEKEKGDSQSAQNEQKQGESAEKKEGEQSKEPGDVPEQEEGPKEGEMKAADAGEQKEQSGDQPQTAQAVDDSDVREGQGYTKAEARRLLDSLKNEEDRIMLFDKKWREPVYKDW